MIPLPAIPFNFCRSLDLISSSKASGIVSFLVVASDTSMASLKTFSLISTNVLIPGFSFIYKIICFIYKCQDEKRGITKEFLIKSRGKLQKLIFNRASFRLVKKNIEPCLPQAGAK